jgi:P27 family predicted phage terminase small subunit
MAGRKPKSVEAILAEGNKCKLTKEEIEERRGKEAVLKNLAKNKIKPPTWLGKIAKKVFREIAKELEPIDILANVDVHALAIASNAIEKYIECTVTLHGEDLKLEVVTSRGINIVENPTVKTQLKYADQYKKYAAELGLTPAARLKIVNQFVKEVNDEDDEFDRTFG